MATVNINGSSDAFYRYKMPEILVKHHKKTTRIENIGKLAKSLKRPLIYFVKWFSKEFSTSCSFEIGVLILRGTHTPESITSCLKSFIKLMVLCKNCGNPETVVNILSKTRLELNCKACGYLTKLQCHDHSLIKFICGDFTPKKAFKTSDVVLDSAADTDSDLVGWSCDTSDDAVKQRATEFFDLVKEVTVPKNISATISDNISEESDDDFIVFEAAAFKMPKRDVEYESFIDDI